MRLESSTYEVRDQNRFERVAGCDPITKNIIAGEIRNTSVNVETALSYTMSPEIKRYRTI